MWQIPQHDLPGREPLPDEVVHSRRERVFLPIAALFIAAATMLPLLGVGKLYGASWIVRLFEYEPNVPLVIPIGVLALPIAFLSLNMVGALYGRSRARGLVVTALVIWLGVLGLAWATDHLPAYDNTLTHGFKIGLAVVSSGLIMFVIQTVFALMRSWVRHVIPLIFSVATGIVLFGVLAPKVGVPRDLGMGIGTGGYIAVIVLLGSLVLAPITSGLATFLRVALRVQTLDHDDDPGRSEPAFIARKERAMIVDTPVPGALRKRPFTTEEIAFFDAGDSVGSSSS